MAGDISKSVNVAINIIDGVSRQVGSIVGSFGKITEGANKANKSVFDLNKQLSRLKSPTNIKILDKQLGSLSRVDSKGVEKLADGIKKLGVSKLPSFSKINSELATHTKRVNDLVIAYGKLQKASSKINLKAFTANAKTANKQVSSLGKSSQKTGTSFSQWGYALGSASTGLSKFGTQIYGVTRGFSAVSKEMGVAMAAFTASFATFFALKGVISDIASFDDAIRSAGAVAQASSVQLTQLSDAARAMGESTRYTATDAAEALKALAMTGLDVNESIATLPTVLNLAAAANMDLGQSADIVTNIMVGYGKAISDLPRIADLMTAAFTNSNTSLEEIGVALKYVGPVAKAAGQSLEETTGILASLANAGYRGSKAGTTLRTAFSRLLAPTNKMTKVLDHYGIALEDLTNENGTMKSFTTVLDLISKKSISAGDALTIFGKRAGPGILSLLEQGTPAIEKMNKKIAESEGTALKVAYEMESGLGGALRRLKSMWEEVSIAIGKTIEQDVEGFITAITKSLKENKDQIVTVVSALFNFVGVLAKVVGWMAQFVAEHFKMLGAMAAITTAIKLLSMTSKEFMAIGIVKYFTTMFTGIKWSGIATGLGAVSTQLNTYSKAAKGATAANAAQSVSQLGAINFAGIAGGLKNIGLALLAVGKSAGTAAIAFAAANIPLMVLAGVAATAYGAMKLLDNNYEETAVSALKVAEASREANRELSYQLAELELINKEFERGNSEDFVSAEERLRDVLKMANISIEDKIKLLKMSREGADSAKEAIEELTGIIEKEKKALESREIVKITEARIAQSSAIEEQAKNLEYYYGVQIDGKTRLNALEKIAASTNIIAPVLWLKKKLGYLDENINKYEELMSSQKSIESNYQSMIIKMITSGKSIEEFNNALKESGASASEIDKVTESYKKLKEEAESNEDVMNDLRRYNYTQYKKDLEMENAKLDSYEKSNKKRESILSRTLSNISLMEAKGIKNHEEAELLKLEASLASSQKQVEDAKKTLDEMDSNITESLNKAKENLINAETKAANTKRQILQKITNEEIKSVEKVTKIKKRGLDETSSYEKKISTLKDTLNSKHVSAEKEKSQKIQEINKTLNDKLKDIEEDLAQKRKDLQRERTDSIRDSANKIAGIETSTEDKLRSIRQRGMTDSQKDSSNRSAALKKLREGAALIEEARRTGDEGALARGESLINQSSDLYEGLDSQKKATKGVIAASEKLKEAERIRTELSLKNIDKKIKKENESARKEIKDASDAANLAKKNAIDVYDNKIKKSNEVYQKDIENENENHALKMKNINDQISRYDKKLDLIKKEKQLVIDLIEQYKNLSDTDAGGEEIIAASKATQDAIDKTNEWNKAIDETDGKKVDINYSGATPSTDDFKELPDEVKKSTNELEKFILLTTESGRQIITTTNGLKTGFSEFGKVIKEEMLNPIDEVTKSISGIPTKPIEANVESNAKEIIEEIVALKLEYGNLIESGDTEGFFSEDDITNIDKITQKISKMFDGLDTTSPEQKIQDMITILNTMQESGRVSGDEIDKTIEKIVEGAEEIEGIDVKMEYDIDGGKSLSVINKIGEEVDWLNTKIQTNPFELELDVDNVLLVLEEIPGLVEMIHSLSAQETRVDLETNATEVLIEFKTIENMLKEIYNKYDGKTITTKVNVEYTSSGTPPVQQRATGGYIEPEKYATGGSVFRRLANRFINKGSGFKDDVPAMLTRGEFVHMPAAVKHYGIDFMRSINNMTLPKPAFFASGGLVGDTDAMGYSGDTINLSLDLPTSGPPISMQLDSFQLDELMSQISERNRMQS